MVYSASALDGHMKIALARSNSPLGPFMDFEVPVLINNYGCIDGDILIDDDGTPYLYYSKDASENIINGQKVSQTYVQQLTPHDLTPVGSPVLCIQPSQPWEHPNSNIRWNEGPNVIKHDSLYYLMYSANAYDNANYDVGYATASSPLGPWTKYSGNPILSSNLNIGASGPGHNGVAVSPDGTEMFMVYATHTDPNNPSGNRQPDIDRMYFEDGILKVYGPTRSPQPIPSSDGNYIKIDSGLVAYYPFNGNAKDASANADNGIVHSANLTFDKYGRIGKAYSFNGMNSYIEVPNSAIININDAITVSAWIKADASQPINSWRRIIDKSNSLEQKGWGLSINPNTNFARFEFYDSNGDDHYIETNFKITDNTWHQLLATYDGHVMKMFADGVIDTESNIGTRTITTSSNSLGIGNNNGGNSWNPFKGTIDECIIYNRALTDEEIQTIYHEGKPAIPLLLSPASGDTLGVEDTTLVWQTIAGATSYELQIALDNAFSYIAVDISGITDTVLVLNNFFVQPTRFPPPPNSYLSPGMKYYWHIAGKNSTGMSSYSGPWSFITRPKINGIKVETVGVPKFFTLSQNYPNPFNPSTTIKYGIPKGGLVTLKLFNVLGQEVSTLVNSQQAAGSYEMNFTAGGLTSGIYFYRMQAGDFVSTKKMLLIK
jgi:hypothetical protein